MKADPPGPRGRSNYWPLWGSGARNDECSRDRKMEESSARSLRLLNETIRMGVDTTVELQRQAEALDRTERQVDASTHSERNLHKSKSLFRGISSYFSRKEEPPSSKSRSASAQAQSRPQRKQQQAPPESTGNDVVDRNLDEIGKGLHHSLRVSGR